MYGVRSQSYCTIRWATTSHNNYQLLQQIGKETKLPKLIEEREPIWERKKERANVIDAAGQPPFTSKVSLVFCHF
jgi:hypothetical protein